MNRVTWLLPGALLSAALVAACSGSGGSGEALPGTCGAAGDAEVGLAVTSFVQGVVPQPFRFLVAVSGDSSLPDPGRQALQALGSMYLFPNDSAGQQKLLGELTTRGAAPTLLVLFRGVTNGRKGHASVRLEGRFEGGAEAGTKVPARDIALTCKGGAWDLAGASTPKP